MFFTGSGVYIDPLPFSTNKECPDCTAYTWYKHIFLYYQWWYKACRSAFLIRIMCHGHELTCIVCIYLTWAGLEWKRKTCELGEPGKCMGSWTCFNRNNQRQYFFLFLWWCIDDSLIKDCFFVAFLWYNKTIQSTPKCQYFPFFTSNV